ncbi:SURF1 family protein [Corynebacterium alimapuense]|uniref:SURF1-like protein n=1 Tax=Corynebacterium alimapuense TaxID=1576874 RepID=A0A3M8KAS4_9CORY|nr:SURF1 family protein [Corynebacterium alimapuense]RNE49558.1 SURF1 family protein [Corynebacterium alimapuense]
MSSTVDNRSNSSTKRRTGWRIFLRPGWLLMLIAIVGFSYAAFSFLAPWQLNKDDAIVARNELIDAAFVIDPVDATEVFDADGFVDPDDEWRRVILEGRYLPEDEVLLRLRPVESQPAFHALTPFQLNSGETILVNRGFSEPLEGSIPDIIPAPTEEVSILGHVRLDEVTPPTDPFEDNGYLQVYGINTEQISELTGADLAHDYVQLSSDQPGELYAIPVPKLDRGSHLSYGFQWIAFGIMAPLGLGYFIWAEIKERRRVREEEQELIDDPEDPSAPEDLEGPSSSDAPQDQEESTPQEPPSSPRPRARYGDARPDHYRKFRQRGQERF